MLRLNLPALSSSICRPGLLPRRLRSLVSDRGALVSWWIELGKNITSWSQWVLFIKKPVLEEHKMFKEMVSILKTTFVLVVVFISIVQGDFNLTLIHVNDIHVRFLETDTYSGTCKKSGSQGNYKFWHLF